MKLISVVVPVLNRSELVIRTLDSIISEPDVALSIIVVDNGSTDGTPEAVSRWAEAHRSHELDVQLLSEPRRGAAVARNRGLAAVRTPWVMFFDSDDIMFPSHIARVRQAIESNPDADIIGWDTVSAKGKKLIFSADSWDMLFRGGMATQRWVARTAVVRRAGGWNEKLSLWDDIELGARMLAMKAKAVKTDGNPTVRINMGPDSITMKEHRLDEEAIESALDALEKAMPALAEWTPFKRVIVAGNHSTASPETSARMLNRSVRTLPQSASLLRTIWTLARFNIPGITHITKILISKR